ncbi:glutathione ABC transporter permease GsiC [Paramaledivibacter caminithermalis]|jgi:glutathione transport system permease protein|uniref:Glutathione transport system permease protein GsiC n=1 Tax=Paramaledivibacter caminithermalis (strain DSM 15212 / CIP 107654 / DViRD3) TaxID=1121301 RepID=A0A1M6KQP7_PARC5|nr:glutathione ABC transporter permease GsiC [Paramaledivibacter caminithermalis]SHJ61252.1 glutathione transport system permease protein [Paramaledivibacter caminithermalis DSM 15212]
MLNYTIRRVLGVIPTLILISIFVFLFIHLIPGDPARIVAGEDATAADVELIREELGLNRPLYVQYITYMKGILHGDLGTSLKTKKPVLEEIKNRFVPTLTLTLFSIFWSVIFGLLIGIISAVNRGKWQDYTGMFAAVSGISLPSFWLGLMLVQIFSVKLGWLPTGGYGTFKHFILPSMTLGAGVAAIIARFARSSVMDILKEDYVRTARAKGLIQKVVVWRHVFRNALIPIVTMVGLQFGFLLGGSVVIETVFSWPGMGSLLIDSVAFRDYPMIQSEILIFSLQFIIINLIVDLLYAVLNPEISYR